MHCIVPHVVSSLCCFATPGAPERSGTGGGPQPWPRRAAPLALLPGHVLQQAFVWLSHGVVEMAWPVPKPDISSKRAEQCMGEKGKHEHLLPSSHSGTAESSPQPAQQPPPCEEGGERPLFLSQGWGSPCSIGRERGGLRGAMRVTQLPACSLGQCPLPPAWPLPGVSTRRVLASPSLPAPP